MDTYTYRIYMYANTIFSYIIHMVWKVCKSGKYANHFSTYLYMCITVCVDELSHFLPHMGAHIWRHTAWHISRHTSSHSHHTSHISRHTSSHSHHTSYISRHTSSHSVHTYSIWCHTSSHSVHTSSIWCHTCSIWCHTSSISRQISSHSVHTVWNIYGCSLSLSLSLSLACSFVLSLSVSLTLSLHDLSIFLSFSLAVSLALSRSLSLSLALSHSLSICRYVRTISGLLSRTGALVICQSSFYPLPLLCVLCHLSTHVGTMPFNKRGFTRPVWGTSKPPPSFLIQSDSYIVYLHSRWLIYCVFSFYPPPTFSLSLLPWSLLLVKPFSDTHYSDLHITLSLPLSVPLCTFLFVSLYPSLSLSLSHDLCSSHFTTLSQAISHSLFLHLVLHFFRFLFLSIFFCLSLSRSPPLPLFPSLFLSVLFFWPRVPNYGLFGPSLVPLCCSLSQCGTVCCSDPKHHTDYGCLSVAGCRNMVQRIAVTLNIILITAASLSISVSLSLCLSLFLTHFSFFPPPSVCSLFILSTTRVPAHTLATFAHVCMCDTKCIACMYVW